MDERVLKVLSVMRPELIQEELTPKLNDMVMISEIYAYV